MIKKLVGLAFVLAVLGGIDYWAKKQAINHLEDNAARLGDQNTNSEATIGTVTFLPGLLLGGDVKDVTVRLENVDAAAMRFTFVRFEADKIELDRSIFMSRTRVDVESVTNGMISAEIPVRSLMNRLDGREVRLSPDKVEVDFGGQMIETEVELTEDRKLTFTAPGQPPVTIDFPANDFVPCEPPVKVRSGSLFFSCEVDTVPDILLRKTNRF